MNVFKDSEIRQGAQGITSTATTVSIDTRSAATALFECTVDSTFTCTVEAQFSVGGSWLQLQSILIHTTSAEPQPAGTTLTVVTGDVIIVPCPACVAVRVKRAGGTATFTSIASPVNSDAFTSMVAIKSDAFKFANFTTSSSGDTTVVSGVAGKKVKVIGYGLNANGTTNVKFTDGASGSTVGMLLYLIANVGSNDRGSVISELFETSAGNALVVNNSAAVAISGHVTYLQEP